MSMTWDISLVEKAKGKDVDAFTELYRIIAKSLYRTALYQLGNAADAEDLVSETVLDAWKGIGNLRDEANFGAWIMRILQNKCRMRRKQYAETPTMISTEENSEQTDYLEAEAAAEPRSAPETDPEQAAERLDVRQALAELSEEDRQIVLLSAISGYTTREIAGILSMNHATVRTRKSRAIARLKERLQS